MKNAYSKASLHKITYYFLLKNTKSRSNILHSQFSCLEFRLQSISNCWVQIYSFLLNSTQYQDCKSRFFTGQNLPVYGTANLLFLWLHPP